MKSLHINPTSKLTIFTPKPQLQLQLQLQHNPFSPFRLTPSSSFTSKLSNLSTLSLPLRFKLKSSHFNPILCLAQSSYWAQEDKKEEEGKTEVIAFSEGSKEEWEEAKEEDFEDGPLSVEASESEEYYSEPPEDAKLYVGNLPYDVDSENLARLFNQAGIVEIAEVIYNRETDLSRGFGFVTMSTVEEAEKAVEMFHRYDMNGRLLNVNKAAPRGSQPDRSFVNEPSFRIYVGNLPWQVDDARLEQVFSEHGKVVDARVVYDRETGRSRGFGFVTMFNESELNDAIAALDGQSLDGRALRVNVAETRRRRGSFAV